MYRGTFAVVDLAAFSNNVRVLQGQINPNTQLTLAIKANAYGHGVAPILSEIQLLDVTQVAVATLEEAVEVRALDPEISILILGALGPTELIIASANRIDVLYADTWGPLDKISPKFDFPLRVHIPIDTGMNRLGIKSIQRAREVIEWINTRSDVIWQAICTHLACSDGQASEHAEAQVATFEAFIDQLQLAGYQIPMRHAANSGGILRTEQWHFDMVRAGIAAYGYSPDERVLPAPALSPVMHLYSKITRVATVRAGETIGYGATFTATRLMRVATVSIGYADGVPRVLSNCGVFSVRGHAVPVVGRICMDQLMIDVTDVEDVVIGDFVTLFGQQAPSEWNLGNWERVDPALRPAWLRKTFCNGRKSEEDVVSLTHLATLAQTISYEILCQLSARVPRIFVNESKIVDNSAD